MALILPSATLSDRLSDIAQGYGFRIFGLGDRQRIRRNSLNLAAR